MDKKVKRHAIVSIIIGFFGQAAVLLYLTKIYTAFEWELIAGSSLLIIGILMLINLFYAKNTIFKSKELLFYAVVFNPSLVSFFSGIGLITMKNPRLGYIFTPAALAMVLSIIIGFITFIIFLIRENG